tara:strand:+ start:3138 stop:3707 length:570 start_codon:yes stop_codon:yes gene_type:complete
MESEKRIQIIEEMIANAKSEFSYNGAHYLLWGWLVLAAALINYALLEIVNYELHWISWPILMGVGGVITSIMAIKTEKNKRAESVINRAINQVWIGIGMAIIVLLVLMSRIGIESAYPFFILLYGIGTFITGRLVKFSPLVYGGLSCFVLSIIASFQPFEFQLLLISLAVLLSYIIPGHLLLSKFKKHV